MRKSVLNPVLDGLSGRKTVEGKLINGFLFAGTWKWPGSEKNIVMKWNFLLRFHNISYKLFLWINV